jgi:hypothetical protein
MYTKKSEKIKEKYSKRRAAFFYFGAGDDKAQKLVSFAYYTIARNLQK